MSEFLPQEFIIHNQAELENLAWELEASVNQFSLMLARCNYTHLQEQLVERLRELCSVDIQILVLQPSETALYTRIQVELSATRLGALMVFGLETVSDLEQLLTNANQVREEFRKNCPFPVVLWVTDDVQRFLIHAAPDLESWATKNFFTLPCNTLQQGLQQTVDQLFASLLEPSLATSAEVLPPPLNLGWFTYPEVSIAVHELQAQGVEPDPPLQAGIDFLWGLQLETPEKSLIHLERSLQFWQEQRTTGHTSSDTLLREGLLLLHLAQTKIHQSKQTDTTSNPASQVSEWESVEESLQQAVTAFMQVERMDLVTRCLPSLAQTLQRRQDWDALERVAQQGLQLHRQYHNPIRLSENYSYLARVALERQQWTIARQAAQQALETLPHEASNYRWLRGLYLLLLAEAEQKLGNHERAIAHLGAAETDLVSKQGHPKIAIQILETLQNLYFNQHQYLKAFQAKQACASIEQQYGFRAFIGAKRLQPHQREVTELQLATDYDQVALEIGIAGRQKDLARLVERIGRNDYRLTVIHGSSGVGKSSLVQAGLVPTLRQKNLGVWSNAPLVIQSYTQWVWELDRLLNNFFQAQDCTITSVPTNASLLERLRYLEGHKLRTILIFDQFEEFFFVYPDPQQRQFFFNFLIECLTILSLNIVLLLREDYLHLLLELNQLLLATPLRIDVLSHHVLYKLDDFSCEDAQVLIQDLTERAHFHLEPALIKQLVTDLAEDNRSIRPIELQIVGDQLQSENITTLAQYETLGPTAKQILVKRYVEKIVQACGPDNNQLAELVLFLLTDERGTRPIKARSELHQDLCEFDPSLSWNTDSLDLILTIFVESGLIILSSNDHYQLVHDYLAVAIRQQQAPDIRQLIGKLNRLQRSQLSFNQGAQKLIQEEKTAQKKIKEWEKRKFWRAIVCSGIIALLSMGLNEKKFFEPLENSLYNTFVKYKGDTPWDERLTIIEIDDASLDKLCLQVDACYSPILLSRKKISELLRILAKSQNNVVAIDILMSTPNDDDQQLAAAIKEHGKVVLAFYRDRENKKLEPTPILNQQAIQIGHTLRNLDSDGIPRQVILRITQEKLFSLGLAAVDVFVQTHPDVPNIILPEADVLSISWPGSTSKIQKYSFLEVIEGKVPSNEFDNKIILVGYTASGSDQLRTPFNQQDSGIHFHAAVINALLANNFLNRPADQWLFLLLLLVGPGLSFLLVGIRAKYYWLIWAGACIGWLTICFYLFQAGEWIPITVPLSTMFITGITIQLLEFNSKKLLEQQVNQPLNKLFKAYVESVNEDNVLQSEFSTSQDKRLR